MTASEAISYFRNRIINNEAYNIEDVRRVLNQLDVVDTTADSDALTVLYSGEGNEIIDQVNKEAGSKVRMIDRTVRIYD